MMEPITKEKVATISENVGKELNDEFSVSVNLVRRKIITPDFVMLFQEAVLLMLNGGLSQNAVRIFIYMLGKLQYSNHIGVDQKTISEENKMSLIYVKKTIAEMIKASIIIPYKDQQDARRNIYVINPSLAWKGKVSNKKKFTKMMLENNQQLKLF